SAGSTNGLPHALQNRGITPSVESSCWHEGH
ncbi:MAG: hypothetical protein ACI87E_004756, partial [Mariniblastus sp.]